jgi:subtilisin family serine protease
VRRELLALVILAALLPTIALAQAGASRDPDLDSRAGDTLPALSTAWGRSLLAALPFEQPHAAFLITLPGQRHALGDGFEVGPDGYVRVIVLLAPDRMAQLGSLVDLEPIIQIVHRFGSLIDALALRAQPSDLARLRDHPDVSALYPDLPVQALLGDSVPLVGAPGVWGLVDGAGQPLTGQGIRVAVLDTGLDYTHPALGGCLGPGCRVLGGYDFVQGDGDPMDDHGHGTHVAGIVGADGWLRGVAPGVEFLAYKVLDAEGRGYSSDIIAALEAAIEAGAAVVNLSLGAPGTVAQPLSQAAQAAVNKGVVVVAAAGNGGPGAATVVAPAIVPGVIAVAAADKADRLATFSSRGPVPGSFDLKPDLVAPGVAISSTVPLSGPLATAAGWSPASGTSMATPHVTGAAALLLQLHPDWRPAQVQAALMNQALDLGINLFAQGAGRLDLAPLPGAQLLVAPGSLSFGLPLLDGTQALSLTLSNLTAQDLALTPVVTVVLVADGAGQPMSPTLPLAYASCSPASLTLAPGSSRILTVSLEVPFTAASGYYQGRLHFAGGDGLLRESVPLAFSLLSRVQLRVTDERGDEVRGWGHMAVLASTGEGGLVVSNAPLSLPASLMVPAGDYYAQAFGRFGLYDDQLIAGLPAQVPYALIQPVSVSPHGVQTVTLSVADAREYQLEATDPAGNPVFVQAWAAGFHFHRGATTWNTRLGQSSVGVLSTDLSPDWPPSFSLRLSDTPPGVSFGLAMRTVGYSPRYRDFVLQHGSRWPSYPEGRFGFPLVGSADRATLLAWEHPSLGGSTPATFAVADQTFVNYTQKADLPGLLGAPWLGWEVAADGWFYPPSGANSMLEPVPVGLARTLAVSGAHQLFYWVGQPGNYGRYSWPFYALDEQPTVPWAQDPNVLLPEGRSLQPAPGEGAALTLGSGPVYPALAFDNRPGAIQMGHPLLASASGAALAGGSGAPLYALAVDGQPLVAGSLPEVALALSPLRRWTDLPSGSYELLITPTTEAAALGAGSIGAGFVLTDTPGADLDPPRVLGLDVSPRFDPTAPLTATWRLSDSSPVTLAAAIQAGQGAWSSLTVQPGGDGHFVARIEPGSALTFSLAYTATDTAGNWLSWRPDRGPTAWAQVPVTLSFSLDPPAVVWTRQPVTIRIRGALQKQDGAALSDSPVWLRLRAGGHLAGYVRDLTGSAGSYRTGEIDFAWTFTPATFADQPGPLPVQLEFDIGVYAPQTVSRTLDLLPPVYLPLVWKGGQP